MCWQLWLARFSKSGQITYSSRSGHKFSTSQKHSYICIWALRQCRHLACKMAANTVDLFLSDNSSNEFTGFSDFSTSERLSTVNYSDIEGSDVSSVGSDELSDSSDSSTTSVPTSIASTSSQSRPCTGEHRPRPISVSSNGWSTSLTAKVTELFSGHTPGPTEPLPPTANELDFFGQFVSSSVMEVSCTNTPVHPHDEI